MTLPDCCLYIALDFNFSIHIERMSVRVLIINILLLISHLAYAQDSIPERHGMVNDFEFLLTDSQKTVLTTLAESYKKETGDDLVIVTVKNIGPYSNMNDYSLALMNKWKPGTNGKNNGLLIVLSSTLGTLRIENGRDIERRMSNARTKYIMDYFMMPYLLNAQFFGALKAGLKEAGEFLRRHP